MSRRTLSAIGGIFEIFGSAISASRAVEGRRNPSARDLKNLGIDPSQFRAINKF
jgi:hypothetical protein